MLSIKNMENTMALLLIIGTLVSAVLVCVGFIFFLIQHGQENLHSDLLHQLITPSNMHQVWQTAFSLTPLSMVELGLLLLVTTQLFRVALLLWYYVSIGDLIFSGISCFILLTLIYSFIFRH
jgi:uncharacterized membrane protein